MPGYRFTHGDTHIRGHSPLNGTPRLEGRQAGRQVVVRLGEASQ